MEFPAVHIAKRCLLAGLLGALSSTGIAASTSPEWVSLFDGKSLAGWTPKVNHHRLGDNYARTFSAEDGMIRVRYDRYPRFRDEFAHLFYKTPFTDYRLRLDYRFTGSEVVDAPPWARSNSGVMISSQSPRSIARDQPFPISIEVQLRNSDLKEERHTANICSPGTRYVLEGVLTTNGCSKSTSPMMHGGAWVHLEIEVHGSDRVAHFIDGREVIRYERPQLDPLDTRGLELTLLAGHTIEDTLIDTGYIALQAEGTRIDFRNIEIMALPH
jgi:hypothetical protein